MSAHDEFARIRDTSIEDLEFADYANLRVGGTDAYSRMGVFDLERELDEAVILRVHDAIDNERSGAAAYRWILRGLSVDKAITKVMVDDAVGRGIRRGVAVRSLPIPAELKSMLQRRLVFGG